MVRNGKAAERTLATGAEALKVQAPRVDDRWEGKLSSSYILLKCARRFPRFADAAGVVWAGFDPTKRD